MLLWQVHFHSIDETAIPCRILQQWFFFNYKHEKRSLFAHQPSFTDWLVRHLYWRSGSLLLFLLSSAFFFVFLMQLFWLVPTTTVIQFTLFNFVTIVHYEPQRLQHACWLMANLWAESLRMYKKDLVGDQRATNKNSSCWWALCHVKSLAGIVEKTIFWCKNF